MQDGVVIYLSRLGAPLQAHERSTLTAVAKGIAQLKHCEFGGCYRAHNDLGTTFFVPDDTLMRDEAVCLDIGGPRISSVASSVSVRQNQGDHARSHS